MEQRHISLYRKWRPDKFSDLVGQDDIITTIKNQIINNKVSHAYIFTGTRGTGKTSTAKLVAKAVNCLDPMDGEPCHRCSACLNFHRSIDVLEIDAASNRGIDDIRKIQEDIIYHPVDSKYKVYIVDEVHMLTKEAFNALLKTLEEPPSYVIFILATTEYYKVPATIRSRCQKFEFHRIPLEAMVERMQFISGAEDRFVETSALRLIAINSDGAMRDALSMLEQSFAIAYGVKVTEEIVANMLGCSNSEMVMDFCISVLALDIKGIHSMLDFLIKKGKDIAVLLQDTLKILRDSMLCGVTKGAAQIEGTKEYVESVNLIAKGYQVEKIIYSIGEINSIAYKSKFQLNSLVFVETGLTLMCLPAIKQADYTTVSTRVDLVEEKLNSLINSGKVVIKENLIEKVLYKPSVMDLDGFIGDHLDDPQQSVTQAIYKSESIDVKAEKEALTEQDDKKDLIDENTNTAFDFVEMLKKNDIIFSQLVLNSKVECHDKIIKITSIPDFKVVLEEIYTDVVKNAGLEIQLV